MYAILPVESSSLLTGTKPCRILPP